MAVTLTSPVLGQEPGYVYTGPLEAWLLATGYAKQDGYTGPGVANTGASAADLGDDPREAENREAPRFPASPATNVTIANDGTNLTKTKFPAPGFDFDADAVDTEAPSNLTFEPNELPLAGDAVTVFGQNLEGVTAATVGATAVTDLDVDNAGDGIITFVAPAKAAGSYDVVLTDASGNSTSVGALTYA